MAKNSWVYLILSCLLFTACGTHQTQTESAGAGNQKVNTSPASPATSSPAKADLIFYGKWKIDHVVVRASINGLTQEIENQLLGEEVELTPNKFKSDQVLQNPKYTITYVSAKDFLKEYRINPKKLGIEGDKIFKLVVSDPTNFKWAADACEVYVKDKNTMMLYRAGGVFEMIRE